MAVFRDARRKEFPEIEEDIKRHDEKVREALRENLDDLLSIEEIISMSPGQIIKIPLKSIREFQLAFGEENPRIIQAPGAKEGDKIEKPKYRLSKVGPGAGDQPGEDIYNAESTSEELWELIDEALGLPRLEEKTPEVKKEKKTRFRRTRKRPVLLHVDWVKTAEARIKRRKTEKGKKDKRSK